MIEDDIEHMKADKLEKEKASADLTQLFPELKTLDEAIVKPTVRRLKNDEKQICMKLVKKYGADNFGRMARDIKVNYL